MIKTYLLLTFKNLKKNILYSMLVVCGLALGIITFISTVLWSSWHLNFDRSYEDFNIIYRLTFEENDEDFHRHMARIIHGDVLQRLTFARSFADIEYFGRLAPFRKAVIQIEEKEYYEDYAYSCDPALVEIFKPRIIQGDPAQPLSEPLTVLLTRSTATKFFGNTDPLGKTIRIIHQFSVDPQEFTISGIIDDFPDNSHLRINILTSFENPLVYDATAWCYVKLKKDADPARVEKDMKLYIDANFEEDYVSRITPRLQALADIHLHSNKPREITSNVNFKSVIIILVAGMFVFLLSWFNFTLLFVSQNQLNIKRLVIQWQMGAGRMELFRQFFMDFMITGMISLIIGLLLIFLLKGEIVRLSGEFIFQDQRLLVYSIMILIFLLLLSSLVTAGYSTYRLYRYLTFDYLSSNISTFEATGRNIFIRIIIISEFIITYILLSNLFLIQKQTIFAISNQMGANDPATIQIPDLHRKVINNYPLFREKILESPLIKEATASMEEPSGQTMDAFDFEIDGFDESDNKLYLYPVDENFFRFYDLQILYGNDIPEDFSSKDSFEYFVLNQTAANMIAGDKPEQLIGRKIVLDYEYTNLISPGIVEGIVEDFHLSGMTFEITPMVIFPNYIWLYCFTIRIGEDQKGALAHLEKVWEELFPDFPLEYHFTEDMMDQLYRTELTQIKILLVFSIVSLLVAGTGLFAMSGFFMSRKMRFAAIRKIHGARIRNILIPELLHYLITALISSALAVIPSWMLIDRWLRNFYYRIGIPVWIFIICGLILVIFSWLSVIYHTWKLARLNPVDIIKE